MPAASHAGGFVLAPMCMMMLSYVLWTVLPQGCGLVVADPALGLLFLLACSSLNVHALTVAGWSSQSAYALLGSLRSSAQMVAYELVLGTVMLILALLIGGLQLSYCGLVQSDPWAVVHLVPLAMLFLVTVLAETNRAPFDLPEAEAELVAGYNVEYGSALFAFFFLAEYNGMLVFGCLGSLLFAGGHVCFQVWAVWGLVLDALLMGLKVAAVMVLFIAIRAAYPRYRYDQLMLLG